MHSHPHRHRAAVGTFAHPPLTAPDRLLFFFPPFLTASSLLFFGSQAMISPSADYTPLMLPLAGAKAKGQANGKA